MIAPTLAAAAALAAWAGWIEPRALRTRRHTVAIPGLAAPLRAVAIGDLQPWRHHWSAARLGALTDRAAAEKPDIVFWLGDYYNAPTKGIARLLRRARALDLYHRMQTPMTDIIAQMARLTAPMGAFAVLGNHDWAHENPLPGHQGAQALRDAGIEPLIGRSAVARGPKGALTVIGLDDLSSKRPTRAETLLPGAEPAVLLTHAPDVWDDLPHAPALTLAGHSHGGQVRIPGLGAPVRTAHGRIRVLGRYDRPGASLIVTAGVGCSGLPLRFGVPPEILVIDLQPA